MNNTAAVTQSTSTSEPRFCDGCEDFTTSLIEVDGLLLCEECR